MLAGSFSSDHPALKSRWETLSPDRGTLTLDGGDASPYNLSTDNNCPLQIVIRRSTVHLQLAA